jgi:hypothetical protein
VIVLAEREFGTATPLWIAVAGLLLWLFLPMVLLLASAGLWPIRLAFGALLASSLGVLYGGIVNTLGVAPPLVLAALVRGGPVSLEAVILYGPTTVVICVAAWLVEREWLRRRRSAGPDGDEVRPARWGQGLGSWGLGVLGGVSMCLGLCFVSPVADIMDLRFDSPTIELVLPLPDGLRLVSMDESCGSEQCSQTYLIGSRERMALPALEDRLWAHLEFEGWERVRDDAGCQRPGWLFRPEFCLFVEDASTAAASQLEIFVSGSLVPG